MSSELLWFEDIEVIGDLSADDAVARLQSLGEPFTPKERKTGTTATFALPRIGKAGIAYLHTGHVFGYLSPEALQAEASPIQTLAELPTEEVLVNRPFSIRLNRLHVESYPRGGTHFILMDFFARVQQQQFHLNTTTIIDEEAEDLEENQALFSGLVADEEGLTLGCLTVKIGDPEDTIFLKHLETEAFQAGLEALDTDHPALRLFAETTYAIARRFGKSQRNVPVQKFLIEIPRVAVGHYVAVQIPEREINNWTWNEWVFDTTNRIIVNKIDPEERFPYNYLVFKITPT